MTYLFAGTIVHRDSLGSVRSIEPGAVNWMTAGRGIVHSERSDNELRKRRQELTASKSGSRCPSSTRRRTLTSRTTPPNLCL